MEKMFSTPKRIILLFAIMFILVFVVINWLSPKWEKQYIVGNNAEFWAVPANQNFQLIDGAEVFVRIISLTKFTVNFKEGDNRLVVLESTKVGDIWEAETNITNIKTKYFLPETVKVLLSSKNNFTLETSPGLLYHLTLVIAYLIMSFSISAFLIFLLALSITFIPIFYKKITQKFLIIFKKV